MLYAPALVEVLVFLSVTYLANLFQDNSLEFEKRRNIPVKYNRDLWEKTGNLSLYLLKILSDIFYAVCKF